MKAAVLDGRFTLGEPSQKILWTRGRPHGVAPTDRCGCWHIALEHGIDITGVLTACHGPRWLLFGRCPCTGFQLALGGVE